METKKIENLLNDSDNEFLLQENEILQQENGTLLVTKIMENMAD